MLRCNRKVNTLLLQVAVYSKIAPAEVMHEQPSSSEIQKPANPKENEQRFTFQASDDSISLIWFDRNLGTNKDTATTQKHLKAISAETQCFNNIDECKAYITSLVHKQAILVTAGSSAEEIIQEVHEFRQIDSILIYCLHTEKYTYLLDSYWKVADISKRLNQLCLSIQKQYEEILKQRESFRILNQKQKTTKDLSNQSSEFLKFRLFIHIIKQLPRDQIAKQDMLNLCRKYHRNQPTMLHQIDLFERTYKPETVIYWYTKQSFVFKMVNAALRTENIEQLYAFRFFVGDLSDRLEQEHRKLIKSGEQQLKVYRGTKLTTDEFRILRQTTNRTIATNSFFSASRNRQRALCFVQKGTQTADVVSLLFEITCAVQNTVHSVVLADIASLSCYPPEKEVLFDLGTTFRIESCRQDGELWVVSLSVCPDGEALVQNYIDLLRQDTKENTPAIMLGSLLCNFGHYQKALQHFERLLSNTADEREKALIKMHIGRVLFHKEEYQEARRYFEQAKEFIVVANPPMEKELATVISLIGNDLQRLGDFQQALENYKYALEIRQRFYSSDGPNIGESYHDIGSVLDDMKRYTKSLDFYRRALEIWTECYPDGHPRRACTLNNMALVYKKEKNFEEALKYYEKAYEIYRIYYPDKHPDIAICMENIAAIYKSMGKYEKAIDYGNQSLLIYQEFFPLTDARVISCQKNLDALKLRLNSCDS